MQDTWTNRDLPVLEAIVRLLDQLEQGNWSVSVRDVARDTGLDPVDVDRAIRALEGKYVAQYDQFANGGDVNPYEVTQVTAEARQAVGSGPPRTRWSTRWPRHSGTWPTRSRTQRGKAGCARWPPSSRRPAATWQPRSSRRSSCARPAWASCPSRDRPSPRRTAVAQSPRSAETAVLLTRRSYDLSPGRDRAVTASRGGVIPGHPCGVL